MSSAQLSMSPKRLTATSFEACRRRRGGVGGGGDGGGGRGGGGSGGVTGGRVAVQSANYLPPYCTTEIV